jgi:hypothetical protein
MEALDMKVEGSMSDDKKSVKMSHDELKMKG